MAEIHWAQAIDGLFGDAADWTGLRAPGPADDAILDATGANFTVTADGRSTVGAIELAANATLAIGQGVFTSENGTGLGANEGLITVNGQAAFAAQGAVRNVGAITLNAGKLEALNGGLTLEGGGLVQLAAGGVNRIFGQSGSATLVNMDNTIVGAGFIGLARLTFENEAAGVVKADGRIILDTAGATAVNAGLLESATGGHLGIRSTTLINTGGVLAAETGGVVNLIGATIVGGTLAGAGVIQTFSGVNSLGAGGSTLLNTSTLAISDGTALTVTGAIEQRRAHSGSLVGQTHAPDRRCRRPDLERRGSGADER